MTIVGTSDAVRRARIVLLVVGLGVLIFGIALVATTVHPVRHPGVGVWLLGTLVVHDGVVAGAVFAIGLIGRRITARLHLPTSVALVGQGGLVVIAVVSALILPEVVKQAIGTNNPSVLPLDYAAHLLVFDGIVAVLTVAIMAVLVARASRAASAPTR